MTEFFARARANIALSKYWGKADRALNLPAVPSLSLTLDDLVTETTAARDGSLPHDHVGAVEGHPAGLGTVETGDAVQQARLPGAVRADDAGDRALAHRQVDDGEGGQPTEGQRQALDRQDVPAFALDDR